MQKCAVIIAVLFVLVISGCANDIFKDEEICSNAQYNIAYDDSKDLEELIAEGNYTAVDPDITSEHFPSPGLGSSDTLIFLKHLDGDDKFTVEQARGFLERKDLDPANVYHLVAFGNQYPPQCFNRKVLAIGEEWNGYVPFLETMEEGLTFQLHDVDFTVFGRPKFLGIRP